MHESNHLEEIRTWEHPPWYGSVQFEEKVPLMFLEDQKGLFHHLKTRFRMLEKRWPIFSPCREASKNLHHVELRVKLHSPREESFPIPLKYIDVSRTTHTILDVKQEKRIDDYWNIDGSRDLSDPWTGFTQLTLLEEKAPDGYMWSGEINKKTAYIQARSSTARALEVNGKARQAEGKAKVVWRKAPSWQRTKIARDLFHRPEDTEFKETIKNARKKLETSVAPAMPCKIMKKKLGVVHPTT